MPKTSCRVLTSAENIKNIDDKQKKKDEEARLKEERQKMREQKKKEKQIKLVAKCSTPKGGRTSSTKHVKKLYSILRYAESSRGFTEIKQVSAHCIQVCRDSVGFITSNTFVLKVGHP